MKKNDKEFNNKNSIGIFLGIIILFLGIVVLANLPPVKGIEGFQEFLIGYGANTEIILGGAVSFLGVIIIFISLKTNK